MAKPLQLKTISLLTSNNDGLLTSLSTAGFAQMLEMSTWGRQCATVCSVCWFSLHINSKGKASLYAVNEIPNTIDLDSAYKRILQNTNQG